jgi:hypothetical protein
MAEPVIGQRAIELSRVVMTLSGEDASSARSISALFQ